MTKVYKYKPKPTRAQYILFKTISNILILGGVSFLLLAFGPVIRDEASYLYMKVKSQKFVLVTQSSTDAETPAAEKRSLFAQLLSTRPIEITPVNRDFSLVIEKIGLNAPVVADVSVTNPDAYNTALKEGIAHASISNYPSSEAGNTYLFAHASTNFWELGQYATVFNLLRKLEVGDRVHTFFENKEFVYEVVNVEVLDGWNIYPITRPVIEPTLTLQTCDPPGTTINRLVVTSKLLEVKE